MNANNYTIDDVLRIADQEAQREQSAPSRYFFKYAREQIARAVAMLDAHPVPAEIRQAVEIAIVEAFGIGLTGGWDVAERWAHIARTLKATSVRVQGQRPAIEARREQIRAFCKKRKWRYDMPELPGRLAVELGDLDGKKRTRATLRKLYARDLTALARDTTT